jgi:SAM-dependent methyltransferase
MMKNAKARAPANRDDDQAAKESGKEHGFYILAKYYDLALDRDTVPEIHFLEQRVAEFSDVNPIHRVLETACGTGLYLEWLPKFGYYAAGYDLSPDMVQFSRERLDRLGYGPDIADVHLGDMRTIRFEEKFDAAMSFVNSVGYLTSDEDIISHFKVTADALNPGCLYIIELGLQCDDFANEKTDDETWYVSKDGIEIESTWRPQDYDEEHKIRHVFVQLKINDNGDRNEFSEIHTLRLWTHDDVVSLAKEGGFDVMGVYLQDFSRIPDGERITGDPGGLYYVLKKVS